MASDMLVALAQATQDGYSYLAHTWNRSGGSPPGVVRVAGRDHAPGEQIELPWVHVPQVRHTLTVLACRSRDEWGYPHGVNEKGVAIGHSAIRTRLEAEAPGLTGPDLVRIALERGTSASNAVEILTDLIGRHGQGRYGGTGSDGTFLVTDAHEAYVLEAAGRHWVEAEVMSVRAATGMCLLRQDWDRISRGLCDVALQHRWWPDDGTKLDFAGALGDLQPDHARGLRRWGQATLRLEQQSGHLDAPVLRKLMCDLGDLVPAAEDMQPGASVLVRLGPPPDDLPVCWVALGSPSASVYFPLVLEADPPEAFLDEDGRGCKLGRTMAQLQAECRRDALLRGVLPVRLAAFQQRLDDLLAEFLPEAGEHRRQGRTAEAARYAGSFMQHCVERFEELAALVVCSTSALKPVADEELLGVW